jgi:hypothetical protein
MTEDETELSNEEPTIDWLIEQIAPNKGNSPLLNFNKDRLKKAITSDKQRLLQELMEHKTKLCNNASSDMAPTFIAAVPLNVIQNKLEGLS